jgi:O-antigen/teichoic acid export membrane protein
MHDPRETGAAPPPRAARASLARNAFHLVLGQGATTALAIVFSAAVGRSLGPRDFGIYYLISAFATFAYVVVDWGQQFYVIREVARAPERAGDLLGSVLVLRAAGGLLAAVPSGLIAWALGYDARTCVFTVGFVLVMLPFFLGQSYSFVFRGRDRMELDAATSVANKLLALALALAALALHLGLLGVVVAQALAGAGSVVLAALLYRKVSTGRIRFTRETTGLVLAGGTAIVGMMVTGQIQPYLDAIILSKMVPPDAVGWFGAARNIMGTLIAPALIVGAAAFPRLSRAAAWPSLFEAEFQTALRPILWLGALGAIGTIFCADGAIGLVYGHRQYGPAGTILKVFGPGIFLLFVDVLFGNALTALGRASAFSMIKVASIVVSTGLDLLLIPWFQRTYGNGGIGAVAAFILSEVVVFAGALQLMPKGTMGRGAVLDIGRSLLCMAATALLFALLPPLPLYVAAPACVTAFTLCSLATGLLRRGDLDLLKSLLRKKSPPAGPALQTGESDPPIA